MTVKLKRVDGGLQLLIPDAVAEVVGVTDGNDVTLTATPGRFTVERLLTPYRLADMLAQVRPEHLHGETDWGRPVGKERFWE